jgi:hypothetical protein
MKVFNQWLQRDGFVGVVGVGMLLGVTSSGFAQISSRDIPVVTQPQQRFNSGQDIQPIFEGWTRNEDGSYNFLFGYLNRNYAERPEVPVGESNFFSPGEPDRGQPTYFYPRTNRYQFEVRVPADFPPDAELVWEVTRRGSTQRAYGWLQAEWEIDVNTITSNGRTQFGRGVDELYENTAAHVTVEMSHETVTVGRPVTLTARMTDDELPTPLPERDDDARPRRRDPTLVPPDDAPEIPDNIPQYSKPYPARNHMSVLWVVYRGPSDGEFEQDGYKEWEAGMEGDGWTSAAVETVVTFSEIGTYTLRAFVSDAMLISTADIIVAVTE